MTESIARYPLERLRITILRATFLLCLPLILFTRSAWMEPEWLFEILEAFGIFAVIAGVLGRFWAILYIGGRKNHRVMQDGPYSMCRHPLYFFSTLAVVGFGLMLGSLVLTVLLGGLTFLILSQTAAREEARLREMFPGAYEAYAARVPRILPDPRLFRTDEEVVFSVSQLRRNFADALVFLAFIPLAELMEWLKHIQAVPSIALW
ncbi:isoprenylcysteine carboxylmethyltransferase family protein [Rhodobacter sp. SGA-6-6]|uniref:methyltransferase family protein n=1 Tax=Rhodobacter sp. SGA-6-6 TaxID=2710882 RepID=UPI0013EAB8EE|nr:isoprenylcysteine carboxylmethyltransferase family protein [Rhodobacter sp. SGA-6-6]NGM44230.1 isoprenylcysteine carboxylmethyltransferase family protein [Rhodobacter sp. SGA-6-6]